MNAIAKIEQPAKMMLLAYMADKYALNQEEFSRTVRMTCGLPKATPEEFAAFLIVAKEYNLNPLTKEIYAFPGRGGGIVPIVSIDGWVNLVNSHGACDGFEFEMAHDEDGKLVSCTCRMFRKDRSHPIAVTEYLSECIRGTEPWKMQHRMLRHKAMIQAARYAFGFSGIYDEEEGARVAEMRDVTRDEPPAPPPVMASPSVAQIDHQEQEATAEPGSERSMAALYEDSAPAGEVVWEDEKAPVADGPPDPMEIPGFLDRRAPVIATAADVFDPAAWLKDLDAAFSGAEDMITLGEEWTRLAKPHQKIAFPPDWSRAVALFKTHSNRIGRSNLDAG